ncbi:hypothetical protein QBC34DRAFT_78098 [Podospora aff. communis PSN243]|uniref:Uncharacterized protein n=1 Tax=Podospora aff. communis PSN243 TaxID=3040156 RepID=A0AAV9GQS0_9PEZI|nr:hypothetical protein QBC34DRAFT_78098 [Podospora aff. communis PSN243]
MPPLDWDSRLGTVDLPLSYPEPGTSQQALSWSDSNADFLCNPYNSLGSNLGSSLGTLGLGTPIDDRMQSQAYELSHINLDLASQMDRMVRGPLPMNLKTLIVPDCSRTNHLGDITTPVEDLLNTTRQYLNVLTRIAGAPAFFLPTTLSPLITSDLELQITCTTTQAASANEPSIPSGGDSSPDSWPDSPEEYTPAATPSSSLCNPHTRVDPSTLLLILLCYVHVLKLHVAFFAHVREYFEELAENDDPTVPPLPGLYGFDDFPSQLGNLQSTVILNLVANMFERIELLLGLPLHLRIGSRGDSQDGLFVRQGFLGLAESVIQREDVGRAVDGKGGVVSLRRDMGTTKRLLREKISPL